ncbi:MAG: hypothetical protein JSS93_00310 [Bacteroidetes bacterium]|nr:hypothetical protein [Bacteroidota bacterium]
MGLKDIKINCLAKANNGFEFCCPPSEDGGNSKDGGNLNRNVTLAHSKNECNLYEFNLLNWNAALAHSCKDNFNNLWALAQQIKTNNIIFNRNGIYPIPKKITHQIGFSQNSLLNQLEQAVK